MICVMASSTLMLDPRRLLTFREVARLRSFSEAARVLSLTQPAVSQQIRALELQLGERLIERRRGLFELTESGRLLLAHAEFLAERLQLAETQLAETRAHVSARLRLGAFPSALATLVPRAVKRVRSSGREFELTVTEGGTDDLVAQVRAGELHVALCFRSAGDEPREDVGTRRHDLFEEPMVAVLPRSHRLASRSRIRLTDLSEET